MARNKRNEALVGLFATIGVGLFLLLVFVMGGLDESFEDRVEVSAVFGDVQGLKRGDPVYLFGLAVGSVHGIELLEARPAEAARLRVRLSMPARYREHLRETSGVRIDKSLTGSLSVLIEESSDGQGPKLPEGAELAGRRTPAIGDVTEDLDILLLEARDIAERVEEIIASVQAEGGLRTLIENIREVTRSARERINPFLDRLDSVALALDETVATFRDLANENAPGISRTVARLDEASTWLAEFLPKLESTPRALEDGLAALRKAGDQASHAIEENRGAVRRIIEDLGKTMTSASNLSAEIRRRPWRLLYKPDLDEQKALELYDAAWAYNSGATELHRSVQLLAERLGRGDADPDGSSAIRVAIEQVERSLAKQKDTEEEFWRRLRVAD
jgi:ABC-type transporter Mla subunit MlaD